MVQCCIGANKDHHTHKAHQAEGLHHNRIGPSLSQQRTGKKTTFLVPGLRVVLSTVKNSSYILA